jgi:hypothetical protein
VILESEGVAMNFSLLGEKFNFVSEVRLPEDNDFAIAVFGDEINCVAWLKWEDFHLSIDNEK